MNVQLATIVEEGSVNLTAEINSDQVHWTQLSILMKQFGAEVAWPED